MAEDLVVFIWKGQWQFLTIDKAIFAYGGETMKVDGILKTLTAYRERTKAYAFNIGEIPRIKGCGKRKN